MPTTDGIADDDWSEVEDMARAAAEAALSDDSLAYANAVDELLKCLRRLESRYGALPSILATMGDYTPNDRDAIRLLENAFFVAEQRSDAKNMTYIASSIAQRYVEGLSDVEKGRAWAAVLRQCLARFPDDTEFAALEELDAWLDRQ